MKPLEKLLEQKRVIRVIGFDDAPFDKYHDESVQVAGVICGGTRFEGMLWGQVQRDGENATEVLSQLLLKSKFYSQIHLVLVDGLNVGGFNLIDLPLLADKLQRPCVCLMRKQPDIAAIQRALAKLPDAEKRMALIHKAGKIHEAKPFYFQLQGAQPSTIAKVLKRLTLQGHVPEALRLAHLIGAAVMLGESGKRA